MVHKKWFQVLVAFILIFLLVLLMSHTQFVFYPVFKYFSAVAIPIIGAGILFYVTKPVVDLLERFKLNRIISILIVFLLIIFLGFLFSIYIAPIAQNQFENLMNNIPGMVKEVEKWYGLIISEQIVIPEQVHDAIQNFMSNIQTYIENIISYLFGFIGQLISFIASLVLIPFFLFFMLKDGHKLIPFVTQIFEKKKAENIRSLLYKINETLTGYIQGQLLVSFILGILLFIGYVIIRLDYALTLALFAMVMNVIPFLGPFLAVIPALIVGAFQDPMMIIWVSIITLVAQQVESNLISPNVMGRVLSLHPLTVITVILAGGSIAGFLGILFAVPFYAVLKTIFIHCYKMYEASKLRKEKAEI